MIYFILTVDPVRNVVEILPQNVPTGPMDLRTAKRHKERLERAIADAALLQSVIDTQVKVR